MSQDIRDLLERMSAIESNLTPVAVKSGLNPQQRAADQLPALFRPRKIRALGAKTDPQHPMKGMAVGANEESLVGQAMVADVAARAGVPKSVAKSVGASWPNKSVQQASLAEAMAEIEEDMLGRIKKDLSAYLDKLADKTSDDGKRDGDRPELGKLSKKNHVDRALVARAKQDVEEAPGQSPTKRRVALANLRAGRDFKVGDRITVTGPVKYQGATGVIDELGRQNMFAVVDLDDHGSVSFQASDLTPDGSSHEVQEDPTQQDLTPEPPTPPIVNPTLPESQLVKTLALEDGTVMEIHGDEQQGFEIRRGDRCMKSRFPSLDQAQMALELYRARRRDQSDARDYVEER